MRPTDKTLRRVGFHFGNLFLVAITLLAVGKSLQAIHFVIHHPDKWQKGLSGFAFYAFAALIFSDFGTRRILQWSRRSEFPERTIPVGQPIRVRNIAKPYLVQGQMALGLVFLALSKFQSRQLLVYGLLMLASGAIFWALSFYVTRKGKNAAYIQIDQGGLAISTMAGRFEIPWNSIDRIDYTEEYVRLSFPISLVETNYQSFRKDASNGLRRFRIDLESKIEKTGFPLTIQAFANYQIDPVALGEAIREKVRLTTGKDCAYAV